LGVRLDLVAPETILERFRFDLEGADKILKGLPGFQTTKRPHRDGKVSLSVLLFDV
jgi:hypothetical protein